LSTFNNAVAALIAQKNISEAAFCLSNIIIYQGWPFGRASLQEKTLSYNIMKYCHV
jgi:hypothetical protein